MWIEMCALRKRAVIGEVYCPEVTYGGGSAFGGEGVGMRNQRK